MTTPNKRNKLNLETKEIPKWARDYFNQSLASFRTLLRIVCISELGIRAIHGLPTIQQVRADCQEDIDAPHEKELLKEANEQTKLVSEEITNNFPVLRAFTTVAIWTWLENFVKDFLVLCLVHNKDAHKAPSIQKLKVKLGEYLQLSKVERAHSVIDSLERDLNSTLKGGVYRFEGLLGIFGLSGSVPKNCSKTLIELQQIRNVIVHRNSKVDHKLKTACRWLKQPIGQEVQIKPAMTRKHIEESVGYAKFIIKRVEALYNQKTPAKDSPKA